jgi:hypothetical protein
MPEVNVALVHNAVTLEGELAWLKSVIETRLALHRGLETSRQSVFEVEPPALDAEASIYANCLLHYEMGFAERLCVALALTPHVRPHLLDVFFEPNERLERGFTEVGGIHGKMHGGFLPTGETALFLLAGDDLEARFLCLNLFERDHYFARHNVLRLESATPGEPLLSGQLVISDELIDLLTRGETRRPDFSRDFPARRLETEMEWDDLVLSGKTLEQIRELEAWVRHESTLMNEWGLGRRLRPGYRCLFYGPSGTGKTLTATLLGKRVGRDVYRVALSTVVSKYIGETEKNLERIFARAENLDCLLFFDEADALFGKRTGVSDAHDRYANQEVSYLLQRVEDYSGVVVLATNYSSNIDDAFTRRFQAVIHFPMPSAAERRRLWTASFSKRSAFDDEVAIEEVAERYELSGGAIMNVVRYASLMALDTGSETIRQADLIRGIRREMHKHGKTL